MHKHKCDKCGAIWEHSDSCLDDAAAHTCPTKDCGGMQWMKYLGLDPSNVQHFAACTTMVDPQYEGHKLRLGDFDAVDALRELLFLATILELAAPDDGRYIVEEFPDSVGEPLAASSDSHGRVNSYLVKRGGRTIHGWWDHEKMQYIED
jgi:hypothetical protein